MGGFYANYTLRGPSQLDVAASLNERRALIAPPHNGCIAVFDEVSDDQDQGVIAKLAARLSTELACSVLAVLNHDDDILWYQLYLNGKLVDEYDSYPGYFDDSADPSVPTGGNAEQLCATFGASDVAAVEQILRKSSHGNDGYVFAQERHADLARALNLPQFTVGVTFANFEREEYPEGLSPDDMLRTAGAPSPSTVDERQRKLDLEFYERLGAEDSSRKCKRDDCDRGVVRQSVLCKRHHFEMIQRRDCPFDH